MRKRIRSLAIREAAPEQKYSVNVIALYIFIFEEMLLTLFHGGFGT